MSGSSRTKTDPDYDLPLPPAVRLDDENLLSLEDLRHRFRPGGRSMDRASLYRWASRGFHGIRLPALRIGQRWFSTEASLEWFVAATTAMAQVVPSRVSTRRSPKKSNRDLHRSLDELRAYGFAAAAPPDPASE